MKITWKKSFIFTLIILLVVLIKGEYFEKLYKRISPDLITPSGVTEANAYWSQRKSLFNKFDCKNKIVFLGTSVINDIDWNELLERTDIVNRGIGGDITHGMLKRIDLYLNQKPKCIFLKVGINDIFWGFKIEYIKNNYELIIKKILESKVPLYILTTNLTSDIYPQYDKINAQVVILNSFLQERAAILKLTFIDLNTRLSENGNLSNRYTYDGIHINGDGYFKIKDILIPYLRGIQ